MDAGKFLFMAFTAVLLFGIGISLYAYVGIRKNRPA